MREFPHDWEEKRPNLFYPNEVTALEGGILEIGPGRGDFLMDTAEQHPDKRLIAIEIASKRYAKLIKRIQKRNLTNITLICAAAQVIIPKYGRERSLERIYVLFPDPWPKDRHAPHRLLQVEFIKRLAAMLKPDGHLFFATDYLDYADSVVANLRKVEVLEIEGSPYTKQSAITDYAPSFFEQKWRELGKQIRYVRCRRIG